MLVRLGSILPVIFNQLFLYTLEFAFVNWNWVTSPFYLFLNILAQSVHLFGTVTLIWELPEHFLHWFNQNWVSKMEDVHAHEVKVQEIEQKILNLNLFDSNTDEIGKLQVPQHFEMEEDWHGVLQFFILPISSRWKWISLELLREQSWTGVISQVQHKDEVLSDETQRDVHGHVHQQFGLCLACQESEDEQQIDHWKQIGFKNHWHHQN